MIRFGICDDDREYMNSITGIICDVFEKMNTFNEPGECRLYDSGEALIEKFIEDEIDIFFLDIECGAVSGFDIARGLLRRRRDLGIVYITNYRHYMSKAFVCRPLGFISKSDIEEDIIPVMRSIMEFLEDKKRSITIETSKGLQQLYVRDIMAVEVFNHKLQIVLEDKMFEQKGQLSRYESQLFECGFIKIARGILVNRKSIDKINGNELQLVNGMKYTISRRRMNEVYQMWRKAGFF